MYLTKGAGDLAKFDMREYARQGARARATELEAELAEIYRAFPDLRSGNRRRGKAAPASAKSR